jgi:transcriptional regulator with XRE-family HTH domain
LYASDFAENLRLLCAEHRSISEVCREIGINRQQFNSYLSGSSRPSSHNLRRICSFFDVTPDELEISHKIFARQRPMIADKSLHGKDRLAEMLGRALPGDRKALRRYLGYYHSYFLNPYEDLVMRALVSLYEEDGHIYSKSLERSHRSEPVRRISKYDGLVSLLGDKIFVIEFESLTSDSIVETMLFASYRRKLDLLPGLTMGASALRHRVPFASAVVWRFLGRTGPHKEDLAKCGTFSLDSGKIEPNILQTLRQITVLRKNSISIQPV